MKVDITNKETIKPSSPTPDYLRTLNLSLLDQIAPSVLIPTILFYPVINLSSTEISQRLKTSLSDTLTRFYPLAGRLKDDVSIKCNDEGVLYVEARVDCLLDDIMDHLEQTEVMTQLVPSDDESVEWGSGFLMLVQVNFFQCGRMALCLSISHKIFDVASFGMFMKSWSDTALQSSEPALIPDYTASLLFPSRDIQIALPAMHSSSINCITKKFIFNASTLQNLKAKVSSEVVPNPSRVESISALIWKCAMKASRSNQNSAEKLSVLGQGINLRNRIVPPLPDNSIGNLIGYFSAHTTNNEAELKSLVKLLRQGMNDYCSNHAPKLIGENGYKYICESFKQAEIMVKREDVDFYTFTSWCRVHLYADFGWGKPTRIAVPLPARQNFVILMDTRDGDGVEASVSLNSAEMAIFERDPELLDFASLSSQ